MRSGTEIRNRAPYKPAIGNTHDANELWLPTHCFVDASRCLTVRRERVPETSQVFDGGLG